MWNCLFNNNNDNDLIFRMNIRNNLFLASCLALAAVILSNIFILSLYNQTGYASTTVAANKDKINCISYDRIEKSITITCKSANLTQMNNQLNNPSILAKQPNGVWVLNAGLVIDKGATLNIDSKDTKWLKIIADGKIAYGIHVLGSLKIDSVKITSWNPETNNYAISNGSREITGKITHPGAPRPYIRIESHATGTTNIINSEIAYLGYEGGWGSGSTGLHYHRAGDGSVLKGNNIHHLYFGFYSNHVGNMVVENNLIHDNGHYGFNPHTGTHDMIVRNNTVYDNNGTGIICSQDCYNILIEDNKVSNNTGAGIVFSRNMTHSIVRDNYIHDQALAILVSRSDGNEVYNNTISKGDPGIVLANDSSGNKIYNNTILNSTDGISINTGAHGNSLYSNKIINAAKQGIIFDSNTDSRNTTFIANRVVNPPNTTRLLLYAK
jgi:poly(beta-D-mannuronate) C5 epimerase